MILDGLQPKGISTLVLDTHSILPALGSAARNLPIMPVQVLETKAFTNLATVVSVTSNARLGTTILQAQLTGKEKRPRMIEIKQGNLVVLPLKIGETATLEVQSKHGTQIEAFEVSDSSYKVKGGLCGLVIDARGRPMMLPVDRAKRGELLSKWQSAIAKPNLVQ